MSHPFNASAVARLTRILALSAPTESGCLLWARALDSSGYGQTSVQGRNYRAHRVAYMLHHHVTLESSQVLMHRCDTPRCVHVDHMRVGTQAENLADCKAKGRQARGEVNSHAILTDAQVVAMREEWAAAPPRTPRNPGITMKELGSKYGIRTSTVSGILGGLNWIHVGGPLHKARIRLTDEQVRAIRATPLTDSAASVARTFGISLSAVHQVRSGVSYRHVV